MGIVRSVHVSMREFIAVTDLFIKNVLSFTRTCVSSDHEYGDYTSRASLKSLIQK